MRLTFGKHPPYFLVMQHFSIMLIQNGVVKFRILYENLIAIALICIVTGLDAARDAVMCRWEWLPRHAMKWLAFYPPFLYIGWKQRFAPTTWVLLAIAGFFIHRFFYNFFVGVPTP